MKSAAFSLCVAACALGGCDMLDPDISQAKRAVLHDLKDPDSAKFRDVRNCPTGFYETGEVNSKNAYGGYAGFQRFYANSAGAHFIDNDTSTEDVSDYERMCNDQAYHDAEMKKLESEANSAVAEASAAASEAAAAASAAAFAAEPPVAAHPAPSHHRRFPYVTPDGVDIRDAQDEANWKRYGTTDPEGGE